MSLTEFSDALRIASESFMALVSGGYLER